MSERDWRIFKEDFNIGTRGYRVAKPIRNWSVHQSTSLIFDCVCNVSVWVGELVGGAYDLLADNHHSCREEADLPDKLMMAIERVGYKDPTPIQRAAIPIGLQNRDVVSTLHHNNMTQHGKMQRDMTARLSLRNITETRLSSSCATQHMQRTHSPLPSSSIHTYTGGYRRDGFREDLCLPASHACVHHLSTAVRAVNL
jgi:hypothetical protein